MAVEDVVAVLRLYLRDQGDSIDERYGPEALSTVEEMRDMLETRLGQNYHESVWTQFEQEPEATSAELIGEIEALVEADPTLARRLNAYIERYYRLRQSPEAEDVGTEEINFPPEVVGKNESPITSDEDFIEEEESEYIYGSVDTDPDAFDEP